MNKMVTMAVVGLFFVLGLPAQQAAAHGTHIWFLSPEQNATVQNSVTFEVTAPYAKNHYISLIVTREGETKPIWEGLIELKDKMYSAQVDVSGWGKGKYQANVILMGAIFQHPVSRDIFIE